ncbi:E3 ubiquitin-protein ligase MBR2 [Quillaja saponaria]|uniref:RING-type E3 ubiquitin transferase n=1 Tax=Quillaja saponaria TaxID=32244 RepID=A0AAD7KUJ5_QUISA|nr:E3 ubiquitin-protein ligase MBR2 [Quillaja saponaria]
MQGKRGTIESFPETVNIRQVSRSSGTSMNQQTSLNNMLNPVERRLSEYMVSPGEDTFVSATAPDVQCFRSWNAGEPSSRNLHSQVNGDGVKIEHGWSSSFNCFRPEETQIESSNVLFPGRANISLGGNRFRSEPLFLQGSSSNHISWNENQNLGCLGNTGEGTEAGTANNMCSSSGLVTEKTSSVSACDYVGTSSGSSGYRVGEENSGTSSSFENWGSSCKRKALEGSSGLSYPEGSSSSLLEVENGAWHTSAVRYNVSSSSSVSTPLQNFPILSRPVHQNPLTGVGVRQAAAGVFPTTGIAGNLESPLRVVGQRTSSGQLEETIPLNLSSTGRPVLLRRQSHTTHIPGLSANMHPFPWDGAANARASSLSNSLTPGERALQEESIIRIAPRSNAEHPMLVSTTEMRNPGHDQTSWHLSSGNMSSSRGVPSSSTSWIGSSSSIHPFPNPTWIPHHEAPLQNQQRLPEFTSWSLFPPDGSESVAHNGPLSSLPPGLSAASPDTVMSCGPHSQGHNQPFPRSALLIERQGDDFLNVHPPIRGLAADIEGRRRLISEIRQVLNAMRRGDNIGAEDYMLFDPSIYHALQLAFQELLALGERIGDVNTGLSEETIMKLMKQKNYVTFMTDAPPNLEPCCICQEEYADGENLGSLDCGHDFHTNCIKQWLMQKNLCPICKTTALVT